MQYHYKHITCIPRWNNVETFFSTSFQRELYVVCFQGSSFSSVSSGNTFLIGIHLMQDWKTTTRHGVTKKRTTKRLKHIRNFCRKNLLLQGSVSFRLKAIEIIGKRKLFYRQRIPESCCARSETVDIEILVTSRNTDRKIMQSIRITSRPSSRKRKWSQLSQFRWTSTKVTPIEKNYACSISTMSQGLKRGHKWRNDSPAYTFSELI